MSVITHYTAPLPHQNLALYHPISGPCVTPQERACAQATRYWRERRTCPHQAHLGRSKSLQRESSHSCLDLADLLFPQTLILTGRSQESTRQIPVLMETILEFHGPISVQHKETHPCSLSRVIWDWRGCQNWTFAIFPYVNWLRVSCRELWGPF